MSVTSAGAKAGKATVKVTSKVKGKTRTVVSKKVSVSAKGKAAVRLPQLKKGSYTGAGAMGRPHGRHPTAAGWSAWRAGGPEGSGPAPAKVGPGPCSRAPSQGRAANRSSSSECPDTISRSFAEMRVWGVA